MVRLKGPGRAAAVAQVLRDGRTLEEAAPGRLARSWVERTKLPSVEPTASHEALDGTRRLRFSRGDRAYETVIIPRRSRSTVCVSTQVGCRRGCVFCATGSMTRPDNLSASEILGQVWAALRLVRRDGLPRLRNIVFMGMGEPLDNAIAVERALFRLTDGRLWGFGHQHVTVSTVAPSPKAVSRMGRWPVKIAWSLHAGRDEIRRVLVESQRFPVEALRDAFLALDRSLFIEVTLVKGLNDGPREAAAIAELVRPFRRELRFNLLPVNPSDATRTRFLPPDEATVGRFAQVLRDEGHRVLLRSARGADQQAACGQLVALPSRDRSSPRLS